MASLCLNYCPLDDYLRTLLSTFWKKVADAIQQHRIVILEAVYIQWEISKLLIFFDKIFFTSKIFLRTDINWTALKFPILTQFYSSTVQKSFLLIQKRCINFSGSFYKISIDNPTRFLYFPCMLVLFFILNCNLQTIMFTNIYYYISNNL